MVGGIEITYDDPRTDDPPMEDWATTECHVGSSSGFTPDAATLKAKGQQTRFVIADLIPGETYNVKLIPFDAQGNQGATSTQVVTATQEVGAYHENTEKVNSNLINNGTFGQATLDLTTAAPDGFEAYNSTPPSGGPVTWGAGQDVYYSTSLQESGSRSIHFIAAFRTARGTRYDCSRTRRRSGGIFRS